MQTEILGDAACKKGKIATIFEKLVQANWREVLAARGYRKNAPATPKYPRSNRVRLKIDIITPSQLLNLLEKW